jgi:hypothetical protein
VTERTAEAVRRSGEAGPPRTATTGIKPVTIIKSIMYAALMWRSCKRRMVAESIGSELESRMAYDSHCIGWLSRVSDPIVAATRMIARPAATKIQ